MHLDSCSRYFLHVIQFLIQSKKKLTNKPKNIFAKETSPKRSQQQWSSFFVFYIQIFLVFTVKKTAVNSLPSWTELPEEHDSLKLFLEEEISQPKWGGIQCWWWRGGVLLDEKAHTWSQFLLADDSNCTLGHHFTTCRFSDDPRARKNAVNNSFSTCKFPDQPFSQLEQKANKRRFSRQESDHQSFGYFFSPSSSSHEALAGQKWRIWARKARQFGPWLSPDLLLFVELLLSVLVKFFCEWWFLMRMVKKWWIFFTWSRKLRKHCSSEFSFDVFAPNVALANWGAFEGHS